MPMGVKRPRPAIASGTPRAPSNNFTQQINLQIYKDYATPKIPGLGRIPFWLLERSHVQSVSRYGRPEPYKQTLHNRSSAPPLVKGTARPQTHNSGTPEPPYYQVQVNISQQFIVNAITQDIGNKRTYFAI